MTPVSTEFLAGRLMEPARQSSGGALCSYGEVPASSPGNRGFVSSLKADSDPIARDGSSVRTTPGYLIRQMESHKRVPAKCSRRSFCLGLNQPGRSGWVDIPPALSDSTLRGLSYSLAAASLSFTLHGVIRFDWSPVHPTTRRVEENRPEPSKRTAVLRLGESCSPTSACAVLRFLSRNLAPTLLRFSHRRD